MVGVYTYKKSIIFIMNYRLSNISKEELSIHSLVEDTQVKYLGEGEISASEYKAIIKQYEERSKEIKQLKSKLRHKKEEKIKN